MDHVRSHVSLAGFVLLAGLWLAPTAQAALFRAYLSVNGNDASPCTVDKPCRLLPAALDAVNDGGEIWMVDSANFNTGTVVIGKSVTILAVPGARGSIVANGGDAILVNSPNARVALRNVHLLNLAVIGSTGINFSQGVELTIEGCEITGVSIGVGMLASNSKLVLKDSVIRDTTNEGLALAVTTTASLTRVHLINDGIGISMVGASATVADSFLVNNTSGVQALLDGGDTHLNITRSTLDGNAVAVHSLVQPFGGTISMTLAHNTITGSTIGVLATGYPPATSSVVLEDNTLTRDVTAVSYDDNVTVYSRGNNTLKLNGTDVSGAAFTSLAGM